MLSLLQHVFVARLLLVALLGLAGTVTAQEDPDYFPRALRDAVILKTSGISGEGLNFFGFDTDLSPNGFGFDPERGYAFDSATALLTIDLGAVRPLHAVFLQGDGDDTIVVEGSVDGDSWTIVWFAPPIEGAGLQSRALELPHPRPTRFLRLRPGVGTPPFGVTRLAVYDAPPPPGWNTGVGKPRSARTIWSTSRLALLLAVLGLVTALIGCGAPWLTPTRRARRIADIALGMLAVVGLALSLGLSGLGFRQTVHYWDMLHYFLGAKYQVELRYDGLYECLIVADHEAGFEMALTTETVRDLRTNDIVSTTPTLLAPNRCLDRFTPARWREFREDARWFRTKMSRDRWVRIRYDHGFNGSPVWLIVPTVLTRAIPLNDTTVRIFTSLDTLLIVAMWLIAWWGFGWRGAAAGMIFAGTNGIADPSWTSGAFLRFDWLFFTVLSLSAARRNYPLLGGMALGTAALLRIFPGFIALGLGLRFIVLAWRERRLDRALLRFCGGALVAGAVLVPTSYLVVGSHSLFSDFVFNSQKHLNSPASNYIGLKLIVSRTAENREEILRVPGSVDEFVAWREAERRSYLEGRWLYRTTAALFIVLLLIAAGRVADHGTLLILGVGTLPFLLQLSNYYYVVLLVFALLWGAVAEAPALLIGLGFLARLVDGGGDATLWVERSQMVLVFIWLVTTLAVSRINENQNQTQRSETVS